MEARTYQYTDDSWEDYGDTFDDEGDSFPPLLFEAYNAVGWEQNGSATSEWQLYIDVIAAHKASQEGADTYEVGHFANMLFEGFTLQELKDICTREGIVLEEISLDGE